VVTDALISVKLDVKELILICQGLRFWDPQKL